jgi:chemosensory pili system protein ChpA (sensor histidine kinase/response regulator)
MTGATLLGDGRVVLILNLPELVRDVFRPRAQVFEAGLEPSTEPRFSAKPVAQLQAATKMPNAPNAPLTVMVVDDSLSVRRVLSNRLTTAGWTPLQAKDGLDAFEQLQQMKLPPDLMLVDIEMPADGRLRIHQHAPQAAGLRQPAGHRVDLAGKPETP